MPINIQKHLEVFKKKNEFIGKGPLSVALVVTEHAKTQGLPLDPDLLVTKGGGQVLNLGKSAVQAILKRHGINRLLASEGGRTSRGSLGNMREYVEFLNHLNEKSKVNLEEIESFWITSVHEFFAGKPFTIKLDSSKSLRTVIRGVLQQARSRQKSNPGMQYSGAVLQHLVGAKLDCVLGKDHFQHHSFSTADSPNSRAGDFFLGDVAIHVTTTPNEAVIERCRENLDDGFRPMLITLEKGLTVAEGLANNVGLFDRIDMFEIEQFIALNLYELGKFSAKGRQITIRELVERYNEIVEKEETDPSLKIAIRK